MAFNWAGAADGMDDALQQAIKMRLAEQEMAQRRMQIESMGEDRKLNREIQQQNAESLRMSREAQAEERRQKMEDRRKLTAQEEARRAYFQNVVSRFAQPADGVGPMPQMSPEDKYERAKALHYLQFGQELPAAVTSSYLRDPNDKLLTPDEFKQSVELDREKQKNQRDFAPPRAASAAEETRAERRLAMKDINDYIGWLLKEHKGDLSGALARFDANPQDALRKARGYANLDDIRSILANAQGKPLTPQQKIEQEIAAQLEARRKAAAAGK